MTEYHLAMVFIENVLSVNWQLFEYSKCLMVQLFVRVFLQKVYASHFSGEVFQFS